MNDMTQPLGVAKGWQISELRSIKSVPHNRSMISEKHSRRQQVYNIRLGDLGSCRVVRVHGVERTLNPSQVFFVQAFDLEHRSLKIAVSPELVWRMAGCWLDRSLVEWSVDKDSEIFNIIHFAVTPIFDFFGWTLQSIVQEASQRFIPMSNALMVGEAGGDWLTVMGSERSLDLAEQEVRRFSPAYHRNCLWLGERIQFTLNFYLKLRGGLTRDDLKALKTGDLLALQQNWIDDSCVRLSANIKCRGLQAMNWKREAFLTMNKRDAKMELGHDDWELESERGKQDVLQEEGVDGFKLGTEGPETVNLELVVGSANISFNELCNLQEGSLIEIGSHWLPMVNLNIRGTTILEGELVRMGNQLMVQVSRKVGEDG